MKNKFIIKDSGKRQHFKKGAQRDSGDKSRPDLISSFALMRVGEHLRKGAEKYDERNWEKGIPFSRFIASAYRHLIQFQQGDKSEDHLAAIIFNIQAIIHFQEIGRKDLDDMPKY